jgi:hypothetical protein
MRRVLTGKEAQIEQKEDINSLKKRRITNDAPPRSPTSHASERESSQTTLPYDVFVSNPVDSADSMPSWPGPDRRKWTQTTLWSKLG